MADTSTATAVPLFTGARAGRDYAWGAAQEHRATVRRIWDRGIRGQGAVATELNRLAVPSATGRPWVAASAGRLLKRLGLNREASAQRDAEALREVIEDLWSRGVRTPPQVAIALTRMAVPCVSGGFWTPGRAGRLLRRLAGEWMSDSNVRLRRGDSVPEVIEIPGVAELPGVIEAPEAVPVIEVAGPVVLETHEAVPRHRAIRI